LLQERENETAFRVKMYNSENTEKSQFTIPRFSEILYSLNILSGSSIVQHKQCIILSRLANFNLVNNLNLLQKIFDLPEFMLRFRATVAKTTSDIHSCCLPEITSAKP